MQIIKKNVKKIFLLLTNVFVMVVSILIPKTNKIVIIGGWFGQRFADNSKYLYLYLNENKNIFNIEKIIWITRSKEIKNELKKEGYEVYSVWSLPSIWYHLRSKFHFVDQSPIDINAFFSVRSKRINLWHGFPLKKIGSYMDVTTFNKKTKSQNMINKLTTRGFWSDHYLLATSNFSASILGRAFGVENDKVIISGYPRNYKLVTEEPIKFIQQHERVYYDNIQKYKDEGYNIIGYFPTFRDKKETLIFGTEDLNEVNKFLDFCEESKIKIVGKFHFAGKHDKFENIQSHTAFINLTSDSDIYTYLEQLNILITDYSSIYFDFLLLNRPIIFFPYDLEYYRKEDRGFIFDYNDYTPGPKVFNIYELRTLLSQSIEVLNLGYREEYRESSEKLKKKVFGNYREMEIEHLLNQLKNLKI